MATQVEDSPAVTTATSRRRLLTPTMGDVVFVTVFVFAMRLGAVLTHRDGDLGRHLRLGGAILDEGRLPTVDIYSHTMTGGDMIPHEWLSQAALAGVHRLFGFDGIGVLVAIVAALPWLLLYRFMMRRGTAVALALPLVLLGAAASAVHWAARPHIFSWLFVVGFVVLLEDYRTGGRRHVWWLVPIALIWANTHGAFISGYVILGTYLLGAAIEERGSGHARTRHLALVLGAVFSASLVNPRGPGTVVNSFSYLREDFLLEFTNEYTSPDFHNPLFWPFLVMLLVGLVLSIRWKPTTLLLAVSWTAFALHSFRNIPLFALVVVPIFGIAAQEWLDHRPPGPVRVRMRRWDQLEQGLRGGTLAVVVVLFASLALARTPGQSPFAFRADYFPVSAVAAVSSDLPGKRVFNQFEWGGYLLYCCWPEIPVFIDGQTDYYGAELTIDYDEAVNAGPGWEAVLDRYLVDWALLPPDRPLAQVLAEADGWREVYRDDTAVVFARTP